MFMLKDYDAHKKGEVVSVPFVIGKQWITKGLARYLEEGEAESIAEEKPIEAAETPAAKTDKSKPAKHEPATPEAPMDAPKPDSHEKQKNK
jgi:hypothetical protein